MSEKEFSQGEFQGQVLADLKHIKGTLQGVEDDKVDKTEFAPVKSIVYGLVGLIMLAVVGGMVSLVVQAIEFTATILK